MNESTFVRWRGRPVFARCQSVAEVGKIVRSHIEKRPGNLKTVIYLNDVGQCHLATIVVKTFKALKGRRFPVVAHCLL